MPDDLVDLSSLTDGMDDTDKTPMEASDNTESVESTENAAENGDAGGLDDDLDALLAGAFPDQSENSTDNASGEPESADVMDILKAAGADIMDEPEQKKEKKGFFAKLLDLFTEEDEEEEEADQLQLSDENKKILEEMDKGGKNKKGKKQKKPKKEKQPKPKKPAKEKKKKEKPEKEDKPSVSEKKLSPKKILPIVVVCISLGAVILLLGNFLADYTAKRSGREAYYAGDYQTCYQNLMGKELDETEQVMYSQSESILTIRMWLREYEVFVNEGSELEALDSLLQAVRDYPTLLNYATQWNAQDEVSLAFQNILNILSQKYHLSQEEAQQIADISDNVEYTKNVMLVLQRLGLGFWEFPQGTVTEETSAPNTEEAPARCRIHSPRGKGDSAMITVLDYDAGNIKSVEKALDFLGEKVKITRDREEILSADGVILPGVGAFGDAMEKLHQYGLVDVIHEVVDRQIPFLGICLGLQLMFESSEETPGDCTC